MRLGSPSLVGGGWVREILLANQNEAPPRCEPNGILMAKIEHERNHIM
jgi:hypothetical protein